MTNNESSRAEEGLFTLDPEDQDAVADYFGEGEEVSEVEVEEHEHEEHAQGGPPGPRKRATVLTKSEVRFLRIMKCRAKFLDRSIWTLIVSALPIVGDVLHVTLSYILIMRPAVNAKIPRPLRQRMMANLGASALIGLVPFAGHLFRSRYRANLRNVRILEIYLIKRARRAAAKAAQSAAQSAAPQEETRTDTGGDGDANLPADEGVEEQREGAGEVFEEKPVAAITSDGDKEKNTTADEDEHVKDKNTTAASDSAADPEKVTHLRPPRNNLEYVQNRDSRFIEDIEDVS